MRYFNLGIIDIDKSKIGVDFLINSILWVVLSV